jgi:hypothetical protein
MKNKLEHMVIIIIVTILSACGPTPAPTISAADVQGTAVAAAWTVVAMTQAAIPTATLVPPTETPSPTPLPTFTPLPPPTSALPTQPGLGAAPAAGGPTPDPCNAPVAAGAPGHKVRVRFLNKSGGSVNLAFGLVRKTEFGECGTYHFNFSQSESPTVEVLEGCYWGYAWITGKKPSTSSSIYEICLTDPSHKWTVTIKADVMGFFD